MDHKIKTVFISDLHLGNRHSQTKLILAFLDKVLQNSPQRIYLIGDIIDGWKLRSSWSWTKDCSLIIRKIISFLNQDISVYYVIGNHDEFIIDFIPELQCKYFSGFYLDNEFTHLSCDGNKYLVVHGDQFDMAIRIAMKYSMFLCNVSDMAYDGLISLNRVLNNIRTILGCSSYWSLSKPVKCQFKNFTKYFSSFEILLSDYVNKKNCQGVICGHIHTPLQSIIGNVKYLNTGDWMESCSAIIEYDNGIFEVLDSLNLDKINRLFV